MKTDAGPSNSAGILSETSKQAGGRVAAIFDLDGTLLREPSLERRFFTQLRANGAIPFANYLRWGLEACRLLPHGFLTVQHGNKRYLTGVSSSVPLLPLESISLFQEGVDRIVWHAQQEHEIVLLSGTLEPLARLAAQALERDLATRGLHVRPWICATQLAEKDGHWTGRVIGQPICGRQKAIALAKLAHDIGLDLRQSHAYANAFSDRHVLCDVGYGHAVNVGKALAALANEKNWPIWHWHVEKKLLDHSTFLTQRIRPIEGHA